jgi:hypothetical protein
MMTDLTRLGYEAICADVLYHLTMRPEENEGFEPILQILRGLLHRVLTGLRLHRRQCAGRPLPLIRDAAQARERPVTKFDRT